MTLVLIHGAGETPALWERVAEHLTGIPVLIPALPGRAGVAWPDDEKGRDVAAYARAVLREMDAHGAQTAMVAGHSLGGAIALWLALEHPGRVDGLGLSCTGVRLRINPVVLEQLADGVRDVADLLVNVQTTPKTSDRDRVVLRRMLDAAGLEQTYEDLVACDRFDVTARAGAIRVPTQIVVGEEDVLTPVKYARFLADAIPGSRLTIVPGVGHALPVEKAELIAGELAVLWAASHRPA